MSRKPGDDLRLGRLEREYKRSRAGVVKLLLVTLVFGLVAVFIFSGVFSRQMANDWAGKIVLSILGALLSLPALAGWYALLRGRGSSVRLYENGLLYRRGGQEFSATWDEIASYTEHAACRIEKKDGAAFDFGTNVEGYAEVADVIKEETLRLMLPAARAALLKGANLEFKGLRADETSPAGKLLNRTILGGAGFTLDADGIAAVEEGQRIAWSDVVDFGVTEAPYGRSKELFFSISAPHVSWQMRYGTLPNAHLLLALCAEMVKAKQNRAFNPAAE